MAHENDDAAMISQPRYLFFRPSTIPSAFLVHTAPTSADREDVRFHLLSIIRLSDLTQLTPSGHWRPVRPGFLEPGHSPAHLPHLFAQIDSRSQTFPPD